MGDNTLESMQQQRPSNLTADATISPEGIIEQGISNSCIFCTLAWKNSFAKCVEFKLKINQSIMLSPFRSIATSQLLGPVSQGCVSHAGMRVSCTHIYP